jgi:hypothetical protein
MHHHLCRGQLVIEPSLPIGDQFKVFDNGTVQPRWPASRVGQFRPIKVIITDLSCSCPG